MLNASIYSLFPISLGERFRLASTGLYIKVVVVRKQFLKQITLCPTLGEVEISRAVTFKDSIVTLLETTLLLYALRKPSVYFYVLHQCRSSPYTCKCNES